jgi:hypothetical protein
MITEILFLSGAFTLSGGEGPPAQAGQAITGLCAKPEVEQTVVAADQPDHVFMVVSGNCTVSDAIGGQRSKTATYSEHRDATSKHLEAWGVYVETFTNGDKIFYSYHLTAALNGGILESGRGTYEALRGSGQMTGIKATGTCTYTSGPDGGTTYSCAGTYSLVGINAAAPSP